MRILPISILLSCVSISSLAQDAKYFENKAAEFIEAKNYQQASVLIDKAIALDKKNPNYLLAKADIEFELSGGAEAIKYARKAISLDTTFAESFNRAGTFYGSIGDSDSSILMFNNAIRLAKDDSTKSAYRINLGTVRIRYRDLAGGIADLEKVLKFDSTSIAALNNISMAYRESGRTSDAIVTLKKLIELNKDLIGPYVNLGLIYSQVDSLDQSLQNFNKALIIDAEQPLIYSNRGFTYYKLGLYNDALRDINKSIDLYPSNSYAYKNLALVYFAIGKRREGCLALDYAQKYGFEKRFGSEVNDLVKSQKCK